MSDDDSQFLDYIYKNWIIISTKGKRNIDHTKSQTHFSQIGQSKIVDQVKNFKGLYYKILTILEQYLHILSNESIISAVESQN